MVRRLWKPSPLNSWLNIRFSGLSLIEAAIVLIIIGLVSGVGLPLLKNAMEWQKTVTTAQNQEKILYALASYAVQRKNLPYAADPTHSHGKQDPSRRRGIVPYADLGLPESMAKDGYNRWFTYIVDDYFAIPPERPTGIGLHKQPNKLCQKKLYDKQRQTKPLHIKGIKADVAFVLISHGPQGRGAYPDPQAIAPQGEDEAQNTNSDTQIVDRPLSHDPAHPFSYKVIWMTGPNLLAAYAHMPCPPPDFQPQGHVYPAEDPRKVPHEGGGGRPLYQPLDPPGVAGNLGKWGKNDRK